MADNLNELTVQVKMDSTSKLNIDQYTSAFDELKEAINNLGRPINDLSGNVNTLDRNLIKASSSLKSFIAQQQAAGGTNDKLKTEITDLSASYSTWSGIIEGVTSKLGGWGMALSAGLSLLTVHSDSILKWIKDLWNGETSVVALTKALKDNKIVMDALSQSRFQGKENAQQELVNLKLLYSATQDHNLKFIDKKKAINELRQLYPIYFKALSDDEILTGKAGKAYKSLSESITATYQARSGKEDITKNQERVLLNEQKLNTLRAEKLKIETQLHKLSNDNNKLPDITQGSVGGGASDGKSLSNTNGANLVLELNKKRDQINKAVADINTDNNLLIRQNKTFTDSIVADTAKYGAQVIANDYNLMESHQKNITKISQTQKALISISAHTPQQLNTVKQLQTTADDFSSRLQVEQENFEKERQLVQQQYDRKLITQQEYQEQSEQLEAKYHAGIGKTLERFNREELANTLKQQQDLVEAQQHAETMAADEHHVNKALLPADKLAAEKQMINDRYDFEIQKAAEAGEDTLAIRERYQQEIIDLSKRYEQERTDFQLQTAQQVSTMAFGILKGSIQSQADTKIKNLESQKEAELSNSSLTASQKQAINDKYKKKEADEKTKAFKAEQKASILQAVINGALAITKVTAQSGILSAFVIPGIIAETAIQVATIAAQKAPQYAKGGLHYSSDGRGALLAGYSRRDDTNAYLRSGEAVVVSEAMRNPWARNLVAVAA